MQPLYLYGTTDEKHQECKGDITDELGETITVHNRDVSLEQEKWKIRYFA